MKIQYKVAAIITLLGAVIIILLSLGHDMQSQRIFRAQAVEKIADHSEEVALHVESYLKEKAAQAVTLSSAPLVKDALLESNSEFAALPDEERRTEIDSRNRQWMKIEDINAPFIQARLTNGVAEYLKYQQIIMPGVYGEIFLTNRYGVMIASTGKLTTLAHAHKYWWLAGYDDGRGRIFLDDRGYDTSVQGYVLGVVVPIRDENGIIGILKCNVNIMGTLTDIIQDFDQRHSSRLKIVRTAGLIVAERGFTPLSTRVKEALIGSLRQKEGGTTIMAENSENLLVAYNPIRITLGSEKYGFGGSQESIDHIKGNKGEAWHVVITHREEEALEAAHEATSKIINVGIIFTLIIAAVALFLGKLVAKSADELKDSEEKFRCLSDAAFEGVVISEKGRILETNNAFCKMIGYEPSELHDKLIADLILPEEKNSVENKILSGYEQAYATTCINKDGSIIPIEVHGKMFSYKGLQVRVAAIRDISERKKAEEAIEKARDAAQRYLDLAGVMFVAIDTKGKVILVNPKACEVLGYDQEDILDKNWFDNFLPERLRDEVKSASRKLLIGEIESVKYFENPILTKAGEERLIAWHNITLRDGTGKITGHLSSGEDITKRKKAEESLKHAFEKANQLAGELCTKNVAIMAMHEELEQRVRERTGELERRTLSLEESNIALKVLMTTQEEVKKELEENVIFNIKKFVKPSLEKLRENTADNNLKVYLEVIEANLNDISASFSSELSDNIANLTPAEIHISDLIRQGKTTKEIAGLLRLSSTTIATHRQNIRKKLDLTNKKVNLRTILAKNNK